MGGVILVFAIIIRLLLYYYVFEACKRKNLNEAGWGCLVWAFPLVAAILISFKPTNTKWEEDK
jgi:hypothetical protein